MPAELQRRAQRDCTGSTPVVACLAAFLLLPLIYGVHRSYTFYFAQPIQILSQSQQPVQQSETRPSREGRVMLDVALPATR